MFAQLDAPCPLAGCRLGESAARAFQLSLALLDQTGDRPHHHFTAGLRRQPVPYLMEQLKFMLQRRDVRSRLIPV